MYFIKKDRAILIGCLVFVVVLLAPPVIYGDEWNLATRFTVNQPTEVPGLVLQPNTRYVIRLLDSPAERHVVQLYNDDQTRMLTMFMAVSDERTTPTDNTVFTFIETAPGYPLPIKEWFYPGRITGLEFIYSRKQAKEIALHTREPIVYGTPGDLHEMTALRVEANEPGKELPATTTASVAKVENTLAPVTEEKPSAPVESAPAQEPVVSTDQPVQEPAPVTQNNTESNTSTQPATPTENRRAENHELPRTGGEAPLIVLIGGLCLGTGLGMRVLSSKS
jgi:hypothetical protein